MILVDQEHPSLHVCIVINDVTVFCFRVEPASMYLIRVGSRKKFYPSSSNTTTWPASLDSLTCVSIKILKLVQLLVSLLSKQSEPQHHSVEFIPPSRSNSPLK